MAMLPRQLRWKLLTGLKHINDQQKMLTSAGAVLANAST